MSKWIEHHLIYPEKIESRLYQQVLAADVVFMAVFRMDRLAGRHGEPLAGHWGIWLAAGAGIGLGSIVPGASVAFLLIYFGVYQPLLDGVARFDPRILGPVVLGAGMAILLFARAAHWFFHKAEGAATRGVLGLVAGSLALVYPGWPGGRAGWICLGLLAGGFALSALLNRLAPPAEPTA